MTKVNNIKMEAIGNGWYSISVQPYGCDEYATAKFSANQLRALVKNTEYDMIATTWGVVMNVFNQHERARKLFHFPDGTSLPDDIKICGVCHGPSSIHMAPDAVEGSAKWWGDIDVGPAYICDLVWGRGNWGPYGDPKLREYYDDAYLAECEGYVY